MRTRDTHGTTWALMLCALLMLFGAAPAHAAVAPGDVLVADSSFEGLYRVDPETGTATPFAANTDPANAAGQLFASPADVTLDASGRILVADPQAFGGSGGVIAVDPATGRQSLVSSNSQPVNAGTGYFMDPSGLEALPSGLVLVVDRNAFGGTGGVVAVDPATGEQTEFSSNGQPVNAGSQLFGDPRGGIAVLPSGTVLVGDSGAAGRGLIAVDPADGKQSIFSGNSQPVNVGSAFYEIPVDPLYVDGRLYVADQNAFGDGGIVGVDPATGKQSLVSSNSQPVNAAGGYFADPFNLDLLTDGRIVVADASAFGGSCTEGCGGVIAVDRVTGRQSVLSSNDQSVNAASLPYENPLGVAVTPLRCEGRVATLTGTPNGERIKGTDGRDVIVAQGGNDVVDGLGGRDTVCAGTGGDVVRGGPGKDTLLGHAGKDRIKGGGHHDVMGGGSGADRLWGGKGRDYMLGNRGKDRLFGGPGNDKLYGGRGADILRGGPGRNKLRK